MISLATTKEKFSEFPKEGSSKLGNSEFTFSEVEINTDKFSSCIGTGRFGKVYLGTLENGTQVAVKVRSQSSIHGVEVRHRHPTTLI